MLIAEENEILTRTGPGTRPWESCSGDFGCRLCFPMNCQLQTARRFEYACYRRI